MERKTLTALHLDSNMVAIRLNGALRGYHASDFSFAVSSDAVTTKYLVTELRRIPSIVLDGLPLTFVHVRQQPDVRKQLESLRWSLGRRLQHAFDQTNDFVYHRACRLLSRFDVRNGTLQEHPVNFQALILLALSFLFHSHQTQQHSAHLLIRSLKKVANDLVSYAPNLMPANLMPWEDWILAESARRTILTVHLRRGAHSSWIRGNCKHELFTEALHSSP